MNSKKSRLRVIEVNLQVKVKVVSRFAEQPVYPKSVGSRGFFRFDPTPVDKSVSA